MKAQIEQFSIDMGIDSLDDIASLFKDYLQESLELITLIDNSLVHSPIILPDALERIVHNLKGVSANLYVENVYKNAALLDDYLKIQSGSLTISSELELLWNQLKNAYNESRDQIIQYFFDNGHYIIQEPKDVML